MIKLSRSLPCPHLGAPILKLIGLQVHHLQGTEAGLLYLVSESSGEMAAVPTIVPFRSFPCEGSTMLLPFLSFFFLIYLDVIYCFIGCGDEGD